MTFFIITTCVFVILINIYLFNIINILEKTNRILEEIRCCIIDVESELEKLNQK